MHGTNIKPTNKYFVVMDEPCIFLHLFRNDTAGDKLGIVDPCSFGHQPSHTATEVTTSQLFELIWPSLRVRINTSFSNKVSSRKCHLEGDQLCLIIRIVYPPSASSFTNSRKNNRKTSWSLQVFQMHLRQIKRKKGEECRKRQWWCCCCSCNNNNIGHCAHTSESADVKVH
jgi:hypothetical protein